jgi:glycosyltransferase involved in cell wall biosynthesis
VEEDSKYFEECQKLVEELGLSDCFTFFGRVDLKEYVSKIDVVVFTSLSEAQPLVILELGAVGIPFVATNVGACYQLLYGSPEESPNLGQGGIVTPLVEPEVTALAVVRLLKDKEFYDKCSETMTKRIRTYYSFERQHDEYRKIYAKYLNDDKKVEVK